MKKTILLGLLTMLLLVGVATAQNCFTALNVPEADKLHWKAITYIGIENDKTTNFLTTHTDIGSTPSLGIGLQYLIRADQNCFNNYLLSHKDQTGITSNQINIQQRGLDYYTTSNIEEPTYTLSKSKTSTESTRTVRQITTGTIRGINYLALPNTFNDLNNHPEIKEIVDQGLCNEDLQISHQLEKIKYATWDIIENNQAPSNCDSNNIVDCVVAQRTGNNQQIAALNMVLGRLCGVPTRIAYGISEAEFDGVNLYFKQDKRHYWIEYYDGSWYNLEVTPNTYTSSPRIEVCIDGKDNTNNGLIDCKDPACSNNYACTNWPTTTKYNNPESTNLANIPNAYKVNDLTVGNEHATVTWKNKELNLRGINLDNAIIIDETKIDIRSSSLDAPATIKMNRIPRTIFKNDEACTNCKIENNSISIPGRGTYTFEAQRTNTNTTNTTTPPIATTTNNKNFFSQIVDIYNRITTTGKIIILAVLLLLFFIWRRKRRQRRMYGGYRP